MSHAIFQNYAHNHPIILELFSLKWIPIILQSMPAHYAQAYRLSVD